MSDKKRIKTETPSLQPRPLKLAYEVWLKEFEADYHAIFNGDASKFDGNFAELVNDEGINAKILRILEANTEHFKMMMTGHITSEFLCLSKDLSPATNAHRAATLFVFGKLGIENARRVLQYMSG